ncbi:MAG: LysM peptidoglycan-binding domain-containing protein [Thermomicrobiales bacterium]
MNRKLAISGLLIALVLAACGPLGGDDQAADPGATRTPTQPVPASTLPPMEIVTRTPVDPARIPATEEGTPVDVEVPETYVVQEGDSLYSIAIQFQLELADIVALNGLSDPNDISVGQELKLPVPDDE